MREATRESALSEPWRDALGTFDRDLGRPLRSRVDRGAPTRTTLASSPTGRAGIGKEPEALGHRDLRRFAARLSDRGISKAGRRPQAGGDPRLLRGAPASRRGERQPGRPGRDARSETASCRGSSAARRCRACSTGFPTRTPLEMRDRAMLELAYSCGLRAEEVVNLNVDAPDFDGERLRVEGKGGKTRLVPMGEPAQAALGRYLERGRRTLVGAMGRGGAARLEERQAPAPLRRAPPPAALGSGGRDRRRGLATRAAALVRNPSAGGRGGPAHDPGAARPFESVHDAGLHPG